MIRLLLSLIVVALFLLCVAGMWWGWRARIRRQGYLPALPAVPADIGEPLAPPLTGGYVGTTTAGDPLDRIVAHGLGAPSAMELTVSADGVRIDRIGAVSLWIPADTLVDARADRALANRVVGVEGLLVVRWRLGEHELDTGVRGHDTTRHDELITAIRSSTTNAPGARGGDDR